MPPAFSTHMSGRRYAPLVALALLAACSAGTQASRGPAGPAPEFLPDANGLEVAPTGLRIDFSRSPEGVIAALDRALGRHRVLRLTDCPAGVVQQLGWGDLVLSFTGEQFVGWRQGAGAAGLTCAG